MADDEVLAAPPPAATPVRRRLLGYGFSLQEGGGYKATITIEMLDANGSPINGSQVTYGPFDLVEAPAGIQTAESALRTWLKRQAERMGAPK